MNYATRFLHPRAPIMVKYTSENSLPKIKDGFDLLVAKRVEKPAEEKKYVMANIRNMLRDRPNVEISASAIDGITNAEFLALWHKLFSMQSLQTLAGKYVPPNTKAKDVPHVMRRYIPYMK